ncbi:DUF2933 domain-containing protein [Aurantimonas sp. C2-6-R+9]|uniref:DUF2933 domain-containing protein n=1 Tax=unclassified Aurantimonas TaxID=2638230 RepID=UPI002E194570|nr:MULTISPECIES: DUF2933 domain-containing protein [unclassified Aurantimonas]MEC5292572.1 DUF2933 domain-containing protein [Aurantimonas sp. C2-3-R2]MEC5382038.1 DUF2933 domain-containing protein [Aurantimonas sp. C2-6-R+9]MEC5413628.1 DUF2933 domain-containing protein [Aurantimonas sp. C2-4-R8]
MLHRDSEHPGFWTSRAGIALLVFLGAAGFMLLYEHRAHIPGDYWLLGGLLAICVMMHWWMHPGHDGSQGHGGSSDEGRA